MTGLSKTAAGALGWLAAAAAIALLVHVPERPRLDPAWRVPVDPEESVARITGSKDVAWRGKARVPGDEIRVGERLEISTGFLEISFDSGAQLTLEGPSVLELSSASEAVLHRGSLRAQMPPEVVGFRVTHPAVETVDPETEVAMTLTEKGEAEVFVLKGAVKVPRRPYDDDSVLYIGAQQARRLSRGEVFEVLDAEPKLARWARPVALDRTLPPPRFVRWGFDNPGELLSARTAGLPVLELVPNGGDLYGARGDGPWWGALRLAGRGVAMQADLAALPPGTGRTIAFWIRPPAVPPMMESPPILAWSEPPFPGIVTLRWNRHFWRGEVGALQTQSAGDYRTGSRPLDGGQWHHIAVTMTAMKARGKSRLQVKQYVDGGLDEILDWREASPAAAAGPALSVGGAPGEDGGFAGDLDELVIADRVLTQGEIRRLMKENLIE